MSFTYRVAAARGTGGVPRPPRRDRHDRRRTYAGWGSVARRLTVVDLIVAAAVLVTLYLVVVAGRGAAASLSPTELASVDTSPASLPYDAVRSLLRMFIALAFSYGFSFVYAPIAARSRRAERVLVPALDILQSVPVLGFLTVTVTGFVALFPGSTLGLECAAIFAIFTSQAWNITFGFYQSLRTQPRELDEAARLLGLSRWRRFWRLDVPSGATTLIWNGMMGMGGGWFFLVASEAITVRDHQYALDGIGAYIGAAIADADLAAVAAGIVAMAVVVTAVNFLFWRPLVAWSERFRNEIDDPEGSPRSWVLDLLRRSRWPRVVGRLRRRLAEPVNRVGDVVLGTTRHRAANQRRRIAGTIIDAAMVVAVGIGVWRLFAYLTASDGWGVFVTPLWQGLATLTRVAVVVVISTIVWVPGGVVIGRSTTASRIAQPVVQVLASFPANILFPLAVWLFIHTGLGIEVGAVGLMALGAQWYILFNVIAGTQSVPSDLVDAMDDLDVHGWQRWRALWLPAIAPAYVTGGITASGGAWNASIVAEVVTYGTTTLAATGLGAYIVKASQAGDLRNVLVGVTVMSAYVVAVNRLLWKPLHGLAERRYTLA